jgi:hypothetical protein
MHLRFSTYALAVVRLYDFTYLPKEALQHYLHNGDKQQPASARTEDKDPFLCSRV